MFLENRRSISSHEETYAINPPMFFSEQNLLSDLSRPKEDWKIGKATIVPNPSSVVSFHSVQIARIRYKAGDL
jgi:hypothetical protein